MGSLSYPSPRTVTRDFLLFFCFFASYLYVRNITPLSDKITDLLRIITFVQAYMLDKIISGLRAIDNNIVKRFSCHRYIVTVGAVNGYAQWDSATVS